VTTLIVTAQNDSDEELEQIADFLVGISRDIPWHISRFHPDYQVVDTIPTPIATIERAVRIGERKGLRFIYIGNVPGTDYQHTRCPECGETVIRRSLMQVTGTNLRDGKCGKCGVALPVILK
jgi:pyruvate formate lyase activating enzyme